MLLKAPLALLLLLALPFLQRKRAPLPFSTLTSVAEIPAPATGRIFKLLPNILLWLGFALLVVALARPQRPLGYQSSPLDARDIMLVLDLSGSMDALDFAENNQRVTRLHALKSVMRDFIRAREGDRMGLVVFGDEAYLQCPLTGDVGTLLGYLDSLEVGMAGRATAIGDGIGVGLKRLEAIPGNSKTIVLVTDGKSNAGSLSPAEAAQAAAELHVKIHVVGIGGNTVAPFMMQTPFGKQLVDQQLEYDEEALKQIADITGGKYFNAQSREQLSEVYAQIDKLEVRKTPESQRLIVDELFWPFLIAGILLLVAEVTLRELVFVEFP